MPYPKNLALVAVAAAKDYEANLAAAESGSPVSGAGTFPLSPAATTAKLAKRYGVDPTGDIVGRVAAVYYRENGSRAPLAIRQGANGPTAKGIASAVRKARDARGRLARWEVLAYRLAAALGTDSVPSVAAVRSFYRAAGGDETLSYTGRGTKAGARNVRGDDAAAVSAAVAVAGDDAGETVAP